MAFTLKTAAAAICLCLAASASVAHAGKVVVLINRTDQTWHLATQRGRASTEPKPGGDALTLRLSNINTADKFLQQSIVKVGDENSNGMVLGPDEQISFFNEWPDTEGHVTVQFHLTNEAGTNAGTLVYTFSNPYGQKAEPVVSLRSAFEEGGHGVQGAAGNLAGTGTFVLQAAPRKTAAKQCCIVM